MPRRAGPASSRGSCPHTQLSSGIGDVGAPSRPRSLTRSKGEAAGGGRLGVGTAPGWFLLRRTPSHRLPFFTSATFHLDVRGKAGFTYAGDARGTRRQVTPPPRTVTLSTPTAHPSRSEDHWGRGRSPGGGGGEVGTARPTRLLLRSPASGHRTPKS